MAATGSSVISAWRFAILKLTLATFFENFCNIITLPITGFVMLSLGKKCQKHHKNHIQIFLSNAGSIFILKNLSKKIENLLFFCCEQKGLGLGSGLGLGLAFSFENNAIKLLI